MWQKLHPVRINELEAARDYIHQAVQLVSSTARSYLPKSKTDEAGRLIWDKESSSLLSKSFGKDYSICFSLDIIKMVLTIHGANNQREHLVLSGMTYPLAFGWIKIKLEKFGLDPDTYNDQLPYTIPNYGYHGKKEFSNGDLPAFEEIAKYYTNTEALFKNLKNGSDVQSSICCLPQNINIVCKTDSGITLGFSPGDRTYIEPYYYMAIDKELLDASTLPDLNSPGFWHTKGWQGLVLLASQFGKTDVAEEEQTVIDFFKKDYPLLTDMLN